MVKKRKLAMVDEETGEIFRTKQSKKRTEDFYMTKAKDAIALAKMKLSGTEHNVLLYLTGKMNYDSTVQITQKFLAAELDVTEASVSNSIASLVERGLIFRITINGQHAFAINKIVAERGKKKQEEA